MILFLVFILYNIPDLHTLTQPDNSCLSPSKASLCLSPVKGLLFCFPRNAVVVIMAGFLIDKLGNRCKLEWIFFFFNKLSFEICLI